MRANRKVRRAALPLALGLSLAFGCSEGDGLERARVRGEVKVDGEPLEDGSINFFPAGLAEGPSAGGTIAKGIYDIPQEAGPVVGDNRVEIRGVKKTGRMVPNHMAPGTMREELVEALPPEFNAKSQLVRKVSSGTNNIDFLDLKGAPIPPAADEKAKGASKKSR